MADNVTLPGTGAVVASDERTIATIAAQVQRTNEQGGTAFATGQVVPTTSAATLLAARETRKSVTFRNLTGQDVWVGPATVTTANGFPIAPQGSLTITTTALIQSIIASGTATGYVAYVESYDS